MNKKNETNLVNTTNSGLFKVFSTGVIHYCPKGIWSKKRYILNTKKDKRNLVAIGYGYSIAVLFSIALSTWKESWLLFFSLNILFYALESQLTKKITNNLKHIYISNSFKNVIESQAKETSYFVLLISVAMLSFISLDHLRKSILEKEDLFYNLFGAIFLGVFCVFFMLTLFNKIQMTLAKNT